MTNCTISGNTAEDAAALRTSSSATTTLINVTITDNTNTGESATASVLNEDSGEPASTITIRNTIIDYDEHGCGGTAQSDREGRNQEHAYLGHGFLFGKCAIVAENLAVLVGGHWAGWARCGAIERVRRGLVLSAVTRVVVPARRGAKAQGLGRDAQ